MEKENRPQQLSVRRKPDVCEKGTFRQHYKKHG
jgi:hypothetical protein